jgi:outer membrane protein assembly factor BamB
LRAGPFARSISAALVAAGVVFVAATPAGAQVAVGEGWFQYQGNVQHSGVAAAAPVAPFGIAWSTPTGIGDETHYAGLPTPVIADGDAIVVDREDVTALSLVTGEITWTIPRALGPSAPAAVVADGRRTTILFTEGGGDRSSSASPTPSPSSSSSPSPSERSTLVAVDASDRKELWRTRLLPDVSFGGPAVDGSTVLVGTADGSVTAVDLLSGDQKWTVDLGESANTPIAAADGTAYVAVSAGSREAGFIVALRESDGTQLWRVDLGGVGSAVGAPAIGNGLVFATVSDRSVRALDAATGGARWVAQLNAISGDGSPAVSADAVVVSDVRGEVYRFAPTNGDRQWDFAMNAPVLGPTVIAGASVLIGDSSGDVSAVDLQTGERVWRGNVGEGLLLAFAVAQETVVAARTGPAAGLVALTNDPAGTLVREQSPTIVEPVELGVAWAIAAVPLVVLLILAGRFLAARLGPATFGSGDEEEPSEPLDDDA